jgi:hypothetical protein
MSKAVMIITVFCGHAWFKSRYYDWFEISSQFSWVLQVNAAILPQTESPSFVTKPSRFSNIISFFVYLTTPFKNLNMCYKPIPLALFPVAPTLENRASVKRFVSLLFLNPKTVGRTP